MNDPLVPAEDTAVQMMNETFSNYGLGIKVTQVKLQNIVPPKGVQEAFEDVNKTLGIFLRDPEEWFKEGRLADSKVLFSVERIEELIHLRNEARARKDWAEADRIRKVLDDGGVELFDRSDGTVWKPK